MPCRHLLLESPILGTFIPARLIVQRVCIAIVVDAIKLPDDMVLLVCAGANNDALRSFVVVAMLMVSDVQSVASLIEDDVSQ